jgi:hypothetical protein
MLSINAFGTITITSVLTTPQIPVGPTITNVDIQGVSPVPSQTNIVTPSYTVTFNATTSNQGIVQGNNDPFNFPPIAGGTVAVPTYLTNSNLSGPTTPLIANSGKFFSTGALGNITITFNTPQIELALLWGSIDFSNRIQFNNGAADAVTGLQVQAVTGGFSTNGAQGLGGSSYILLVSNTPFTQIQLSSGVVSFEAAGITASTQIIALDPEPSTLVLSLIGIGGVLIGRRKLAKR